MEYINGKPYFFANDEKTRPYLYLNHDINCDVLIIGGGINGCILNYYLSQKYDTVLVEKARLGAICTSCATSLLEYQLDDFASELECYLSPEDIIKCYNFGLKSLQKLDTFIKLHGNHCFYKAKPTIIYSNKNKDKKEIEKEYNFRKENGFECQLINETTNPLPFKIKCGLICENGGAEVDPYLFSKEMIENSQNQDKIFENTEIIEIEKFNEGYVCTTKFFEKIFCKNVIIATGFDFKFIENNLVERFISYSIVTNPLPEIDLKNMLIQDCLSPYHYLRKLPDDRLIYGGEDTKIKDEIDTKNTEKVYQRLLKNLQKMFPKFKNKIKIDYKFCGAFGSTKNNMGLIGKDEKGIINFISCGANGIINAFMGVKIVEDILENKENEYTKIFSPLRKN